MRKADLVASISEKTGVPKVDVLVALEMFFKEVKGSLADGQNVYIRGFGSFIIKKRAKKIGRHIKKNQAIEIPEHCRSRKCGFQSAPTEHPSPLLTGLIPTMPYPRRFG